MRTMTPPLVGMLVVVGLTTWVVSINKSTEPIQFSCAREAVDFAVAHGLHCHSGTYDKTLFPNNGYISDRPLSFEDVISVSTRRQCGLTPEWTGVLWFIQADSRDGV